MGSQSFIEYLKPRLLAFLEFIVSGLVLWIVLPALHEGMHSYVDQLLGNPPGTIKVLYHQGVPIGGFYEPVTWAVSRAHLIAVALAGGVGVALFFIWLDKHVHTRRGLDYSLNFWWAQQLTYAVGEALYFAELISWPFLYVFVYLGYLMGVFCVLLELNGVINV